MISCIEKEYDKEFSRSANLLEAADSAKNTSISSFGKFCTDTSSGLNCLAFVGSIEVVVENFTRLSTSLGFIIRER